MTDQLIEIHWTCQSIDEARQICRKLVEMGLVACAQILPWVESIFMWDNKLDTMQESLVFMKTEAVHYEKIKEFITANCQYEVPQITATDITKCNDSYREWVLESVRIRK